MVVVRHRRDLAGACSFPVASEGISREIAFGARLDGIDLTASFRRSGGLGLRRRGLMLGRLSALRRRPRAKIPRTPVWQPPLAGIGMRTASLTSAALALLLSSVCGRADAFGGLILIDSPPSDGYSLSVGPGVAGFRDRRGRKDTKVVPVPGLDFYSSTGGFASTDVGLGWNFSRREDLQFGVRFWPILERSRSASQRPDHSDTRTRIAKGAFLNYAPWQFLILQSNVLAGYATSGDRIQAEVGATIGLPLGDRGLVGVTLGTTWSNGPYMRNSFGVSPRESARDGLPVYSPGSGWSDFNLQLSGEFQLGERWRVSGEVVKARLIGGAGRSPSVASRNVGTFALTIWYRFK